MIGIELKFGTMKIGKKIEKLSFLAFKL